jgi:hypothetical protein
MMQHTGESLVLTKDYSINRIMICSNCLSEMIFYMFCTIRSVRVLHIVSVRTVKLSNKIWYGV